MTSSNVLRQVIYISSAARDADALTIESIGRSAAFNNTKLGITGMLLHIDGSFLQVIEGSPDAIASLLKKLEADTRHRSFRKLSDTMVSKRTFGAWSMGTFNVDPASLPDGIVFRPSGEKFTSIARDIDNVVVKAFLETFYDTHTRTKQSA